MRKGILRGLNELLLFTKKNLPVVLSSKVKVGLIQVLFGAEREDESRLSLGALSLLLFRSRMRLLFC
jgi:hypothetical protein